MNCIVIVEKNDNKIENSSLECISIANKISENVIVITDIHDEKIIKSINADILLVIDDIEKISLYDEEIKKYEDSFFIMSDSLINKKIASQLSEIFKLPVVSNIINLKVLNSVFYCESSSYNNNVISGINIQSGSCIFLIKNNSFEIETSNHKESELIYLKSKTKHLFQMKILDKKDLNNKISLSDAKIVVSAGRGLKSSENWEMIEKLAHLLGAATACSKPVSDLGWRPHSEHVGQTGIKISPEIYFAIGISGAIQHLAGVNSSKKIIVINIDSDAPFFNNADYGIIGDAFEIIPEIIQCLEKIKNDKS